ncbi:Uncharacterised protein [Bordetella pertussis]|nr:Uncharacterised protein [Bordetella pertussis]
MRQHGDPVADLAHHFHLVGDHHHRHARLAIDIAQQRQDVVGGLGVQRRRRLVAEQHVGVIGQGARDAHALLLPAADLAGIAVAQVLQADQRQQPLDPGGNLGARHAGDLQRQGHVAVHGTARQQVEPLEHHADAAALVAQLRLAQPHQGLAANGDAALVRALEQVDALNQRTFARAARPDDAEHLALLDVQVDAPQRFEAAMRGGVRLG